MRSTVLFASHWDPADMGAWSGTPFFMLEALRRLADVEVLRLRRPQAVRLAGAAATTVLRRKVAVDRGERVLRAYAQQIEAEAARIGSDVVVFSPSNIPITAVDPSLRCTYWTDSTFPQIAGLYPQRFPYTRGSIDTAVRQERRALLRADLAAYSSDWAIAGARELAPEVHPTLLEFGPNLPAASIERVRDARTRRPRGGPLQILWIGVHWERKGGEAAVRATEHLVEQGLAAELHVVGAEPGSASPVVRRHGRLSKVVPSELAALEALLGAADLLLLPSRSDCTPVVVSEAAAVGLPVVASNVGGLGEMVERHDLGAAVPMTGDEPRALADAMRHVMDDLGRHVAACGAAAEDALNYGVSFDRLLQQVGRPQEAARLR